MRKTDETEGCEQFEIRKHTGKAPRVAAEWIYGIPLLRMKSIIVAIRIFK